MSWVRRADVAQLVEQRFRNVLLYCWIPYDSTVYLGFSGINRRESAAFGAQMGRTLGRSLPGGPFNGGSLVGGRRYVRCYRTHGQTRSRTSFHK
jgi:hypothetical protein